MKTKVLVTGGCGFIGSHVVDLLIEEGWQVHVVDNLSTGDKSNGNSKATYTYDDLLNVSKGALAKYNYVFHLAALPRIQPSFEQPIEHEKANVIVTIDLLKKLKDSPNLKKLVYSSSSSVYGDPKELPTTEGVQIAPLSPYALQKYTAEQYALILGKRYGLKVNALRYFNVYGPRSFNKKNIYNAYSSVVGIFAEQVKNGEKLTITGDGSQSRDFVHVKDVARANLLAALSDKHGQVYNIGAGKPITVIDLARQFGVHYVFIPERKGEAKITWADIKKIKDELGWEPQISLTKAIKELCVV